MNQRDEVRKELEELSPTLSRIRASGKETGFLTPEGYFDQLQRQVQARLEVEPRPKPSTGWWERWRAGLEGFGLPAWSMGLATVVLLVAGVFLLRPGAGAEQGGRLLADVSETTLADYVLANWETFDAELILEATQGTSFQGSALSAPSIDEGDLDAYLEDALQDLDPAALDELL